MFLSFRLAHTPQHTSGNKTVVMCVLRLRKITHHFPGYKKQFLEKFTDFVHTHHQIFAAHKGVEWKMLANNARSQDISPALDSQTNPNCQYAMHKPVPIATIQ